MRKKEGEGGGRSDGGGGRGENNKQPIGYHWKNN